jgi:hypothetical protein
MNPRGAKLSLFEGYLFGVCDIWIDFLEISDMACSQKIA